MNYITPHFTRRPVALIWALACIVFATSSCKKDSEDTDPTPTTPGPSYTVPATYNFDNADFSSSTKKLGMLSELTGYIRTTHSETMAPVLDEQVMQNMFDNTSGPFADAALNSADFSLRSNTSNAFGYIEAVEERFEDAVTASQNAAVNPTGTTASNGVPGKMITGTRYILVDANGFEYKEFVEKGVMGAVFYHQATTLLNAISSFDNSTEVEGRTAQEAAWDEAFGYFGVPVDFPSNTSGLKNWGNYCNTVSTALGGSPTVNQTIMDAWLKGRAAISNGDNTGRDAARDVVVRTWEKVCAARFISYVKSAKANISAPATFHHNLSEAVGFIESFRYNSNKTISDADIEVLMDYFRTNGTVNLYTVTTGNLDNAINTMATIFGLDASLL